MKRPTPRKMSRILAAAFALTPILAGAAAGEFTFVVGEVSLTKANGQRSTPVRGTAVDPGDRIATGANGMAQLSMVDNARLSLRPATQFQIEAYPNRPDSNDGAVLSLVKGTLRTFTGLLASTNRDKFVMKTRVATVGIRGSGNILYACEGKECDESVSGGAEGGVTVNHTIEGSHSITNVLAEARPGLPAQQGGAQTLVTGPGQTVMVAGNQPPRYIPLPRFIADVATNMTAAKSSDTVAAGGSSGDSRNFSPGTTPVVSASTGGFGFINDIEAQNLSTDPGQLQDIIITSGSPFAGQARQGDLQRNGNEVRGYTSYAGSQSGVQPVISGGSLQEAGSVAIDGGNITFGRYNNASLGFFGPGSAVTPSGSVHWIQGPSGFPPYLSDVLTGTATYTLAGGTQPTNQNNVSGTLGSASIDVNFTSRTLGLHAALSIPASGGTAAGAWQLNASNVPFAANSFFGSTEDRLVITNGVQTSANNANLTGSFEGSFVGNGLTGAILGYGISDRTQPNAANWNFVTGVAAFIGPKQPSNALFREGRVSDPAGTLEDFIRSYSTTDRPEEVTSDAQGRVTAFTAPFSRLGPHSTYQIGSASVVQSGIDAETGLVWGRWSGGTATVSRDGRTESLNLSNASLHYIFSGTDGAPVSLPLTGTANYAVIGSTSPTHPGGAVGTLNSATLNANFSARTVDAAVNISIINQTWVGFANNMPIYRDQYFSAYSGTPIAGVPNPNPLSVSCTPNCGAGATGSFDGFFAGRAGQRAGLMYNLGGNQGAVVFGRPGGG